MYRTTILLVIVCLAGCTSNALRIDRLSREAGLERSQINAAGFLSLRYVKPDSSGGFIVFLEGDGVPWRAGVAPSDDPTTADPMALKLLLATPQAGAYVTRPCYHDLRDPRCTPALWTGARYSAEVAASIASAIEAAAMEAQAQSVTLVGYSGGGVLAVLAAERLDIVDRVVTIAANLDTDAWTVHHGYLPLSESLNPSLSERDHPWPEVHLQGARDTTVPGSTTDAYFKRYPHAQRRVLEDFDHTCCWLDAWPALWMEVQEGME